VLSGSSLMIIAKNNILKSVEFNKTYYLNSFNFLNNYLDIDEKNICLFMFLSSISWHLLFPLIALYYVKNYITKSKKTKNSIKLSILLYIIYVLFNIFILNTFKIYNKSLKITTTESRIIVIFSSVAYIALLYYFETIKNKIPQNIIVYEGGN
jgi:membrane-associated HD superfamily phosphohydrolase